MDCLGGSDVEGDEIRPQAPATKRCKLPKRFFDEVNHSSVPRKLRSGMKKIRHKSETTPLLNSKRPSQSTIGVKTSSKKDDQKKAADIFIFNKRGNSELLKSEGISGQITKDEAEVVETLYTLAGMLHNRNDNADEKSSSKAEATQENLLTLPTAEQSPIHSFLGNGSFRSCSSTVLEASNRSFNECSLSEIVVLKSMAGSDFFDPKESNLKICSHMDHETDCPVTKVNQSMPLLCRAEPSDEIFPQNSCGRLSECPEISPSEAPSCERRTESAPCLPGDFVAPRCTVEGNKKRSPVLWPGLAPAELPGGRTNGYSLQPCPPRVSARLENGGLIRKEDTCTISEISLKRSERHVHLCRFIQGLQIQEKSGRMRIQSHQLRLDEELKRGAFVAINNLNREKDDLHEGKNIIPTDKWLHQDKQGFFLHLPSETLVIQKQKFDFLSLSLGNCRVINANNKIDREGKGLELFPQSSGCYRHTYVQNQAIMPFSPTQAYNSSPQHLEQLPQPVSAIQRLPPSFSCLPSDPSHQIPQTSTNRHHEQQQKIWTSQMAVQGRNWPDPATMVQFLSWPKGRNDPSQVSLHL